MNIVWSIVSGTDVEILGKKQPTKCNTLGLLFCRLRCTWLNSGFNFLLPYVYANPLLCTPFEMARIAVSGLF